MPKKDAVCSATLIILGDDLKPAVITETLALQPSQAWRKGENQTTLSDGTIKSYDTIHKWGGWKRWLKNDLRDMPLTDQLQYWADLLIEHAAFIKSLKEEGNTIEMNCCIITEASTVLQIPAALQKICGEIGMDLDITFYPHRHKARPKLRRVN